MNIYVGNLAWSTSDEQLEEMFAPYGQVQSARVIRDRETGRSRGFGFVEMPDDAARGAIEKLNGADYNNRPLTVNQARERTERSDRGGDRGDRGGDRGPRRGGPRR